MLPINISKKNNFEFHESKCQKVMSSVSKIGMVTQNSFHLAKKFKNENVYINDFK